MGDDFARRQIEANLRAELQSFAKTRDEPGPALTVAVCEYAKHLREQGVTAEQAVIALKGIVRIVMPHEFVTDPLRVHDRTSKLITTCIQAYYRQP